MIPATAATYGGEAAMDATVYQFADIRVDVARLSLSRNSQPLLVEPKAFDVLRFLIEHRDRLVTKDELLDVVWRDTFVTPNVLTRAIAQLRKAIGDDAQDARYIETVTKRGYRFIAQVSVESSPVESGTPAGVEPAVVTAPLPASISIWKSKGVGLGVAMLLAAIAIVAWTTRARSTDSLPRSVSALVPERVTTRNANDTTPAISADGRAIAYVSDRTGQLEINTVALAPGSEEVAITNDGGQNIDPAWSPDGRLIAFHSMKRGGIWVIPSTGGASRQIVETGRAPAWSPDGQQIAFSSGQGASSGQSTINLVRADGTNLRKLTELGAPLGGHFSPTWSHDGRYIAFSLSNVQSTGGIWIVAITGGAPQLLAKKNWLGQPQFAPDDRALYFTNLGDGGGTWLFRVPLEPSTLAAAGPPEEVMPFDGGPVEGMSVARDGTLTFAVQSSDANLWAIDLLDGGAVSEPRRVTDEVVRAGRPDYSAEGRLAFLSMGTGRPLSTWVMNDDGTGRSPLITEGASGNPSWGPGNRVLVFRGPTIQDPTLWWVDVATRRATEVTTVSTHLMRSTRVSPDGQLIAFWSLEPSGAMNVWVEPLDGSAPRRRITSEGEGANYPAWSPDGKWLAVEVKRGERTQIGVVSKDGGPIELLTDAPEQSWPHSWSPDGARIAYAGLRDGVWNLYEVARQTKVSRQLTQFTSASGYVRYPAWSPKGNRIVFEREIRSAGIWTVKLPQ